MKKFKKILKAFHNWNIRRQLQELEMQLLLQEIRFSDYEKRKSKLEEKLKL